MSEQFTREPALAQFNKITKVFTMILQKPENISGLNHDFYLYREVLIDRMKENVVGNYDNYRIVSIESQPLLVTEDSLNVLAREKIVKQYPLESQLSIIGSLLEKIATSANVECEELKEMNDYINEVKRVNGLRKEFYASDPSYQYLSTEQFEELFTAQREGGIMEYEGKTNSI